MNIIDKLFKTIINGKQGKNIGIPTGLPKIDRITYGLQKGYIYTYFGDTGSGKTTYALYTSVYQPIKEALNGGTNVAILFFSFEMSAEALFAKLLSLHLWDVYGQVVSYEEILSLTTEIDEEKFAYICDSKAWLHTIEQMIKVVDTPITPQQCSVVLRMWNEKFGKFVQLDDNQESYIENDKEVVKIVITDHVKLTKDNGKGAKSTIDEMCSEYIYYRNKCNITGIFIQQANRQSKGMDRKLAGFGLLQLDDLSDSSGTAQASEIVIGIYHPHREKLNKIDGYSVKKMEDRIRCVQILKNRFGQSDKNVCVSFYGEIGLFKELPKAEDITDYDDYINLIPVKSIKEEVVNPQGLSFTM